MNTTTFIMQLFNISMIVLAITSGIYIWINARKVGMNYWFWSMIGIALFPIGPISYLLYRKLKNKK